jgi:hypothetical protein
MVTGGTPPGGEVLDPNNRSKAVESLRKSRPCTFTIRMPFLRIEQVLHLTQDMGHKSS